MANIKRPWFDADGNILPDDAPTFHSAVSDIEPYVNTSFPGAPLITSRAQERALIKHYGVQDLSPSEAAKLDNKPYQPPPLPPIREHIAVATEFLRVNKRMPYPGELSSRFKKS